MTISKKDEALRLTLIFLRACAAGAIATKDDFKRMADVCGIVLPMKYRLTKDEVAKINQIQAVGKVFLEGEDYNGDQSEKTKEVPN